MIEKNLHGVEAERATIEKLEAENESKSEHVQLLVRANDQSTKTILKLLSELDQHRWIPVSERLPEKEGYCFVCDGQWCGRLWWDNEWEFANKTKYPSGFSVTHWKPIILPKGE
ncbi:MAG TPA: DUF551 domain-containing protein [Desulfosporosinus sp.]|nr:DUF551 domain-containing protein [Desulfosporosinus sp.]